MKAVLLLFAMIVVAFGQEADEGWEETPPADPPVEVSIFPQNKLLRNISFQFEFFLRRTNTKPINMETNLMDTSRSTDINLQNPMVDTGKLTLKTACLDFQML